MAAITGNGAGVVVVGAARGLIPWKALPTFSKKPARELRRSAKYFWRAWRRSSGLLPAEPIGGKI